MKKLASFYHAGQFRKGKEQLPYIVHPESVVNTLIRWGEDKDSSAVSMAWGHDLLEDTAVTESEILAVSSEEVLQGIKILTRPENIEKSLYLQTIARSGIRNVLLVKTADRICNSKDFIALKGALHALQYLHEADALIPALKKFSDDKVMQNALQEWHLLDEKLRRASACDAVRGCPQDPCGGPERLP